MGTPLMSAQWVRLMDKRLTKVFENVFDDLTKKEAYVDKLYNVMPSTGAWEEFFEVGSVPDIPEFTGKLNYLSVYPGYYTKIEPKEYAGALKFERKLIDDKKYNVLDNRTGMLTEAAFRTREKFGVLPFVRAFSAAYDYMTSEEGVAWCSSSHGTKSGVSTSTGFSNSGTSALSPVSVEATRILMRRFRNDQGERISINPDTLIVPDNLSKTAYEIVNTDRGLWSAEGTSNVQYKKWNVIVYSLLDDYDSNNWYMVDSRLLKQFLIWIDRVKPEISNNFDFETFMISVAVYFRCGYGFTNWRCIYGHNVS